MHAVVCVKPLNGELNPFDACALECALRMENASVTVVSMGRPDVAEILKQLTRLGVSRAVLLSDPAFAGSDTLATAYTLSLAIKMLKPDLILCGRQSIDGDTAQVGPGLAAMLEMPVITSVMSVKSVDTFIRCISRTGEEAAELPAVITVERINTLRFPGIRSKTERVEIWSAADIGADQSRCGLLGSPTRVLKTFENQVGRRKCRFISPEELNHIIAQAIKKKRHATISFPSVHKLQNVWTVGDEAIGMAKTIAENVRVIDCLEPAAIAEMARTEKPAVILWGSSPWSKKIAPQTAALLQTGLCADCTMLETDGKKLLMYRPAFGGSIIAKIACLTLPQMATVRTVQSDCEDVILAVGAGAVNDLPRLRAYAGKMGYTMAASRTLVDKGLAPYEWQVGLTGRSVSPKVYIACGISGTVQHTCAIEQAGTVIAINPDRNARIFEYADYGIQRLLSDVFL
jgi:electron transfer flavoprotein alpha subunit